MKLSGYINQPSETILKKTRNLYMTRLASNLEKKFKAIEKPEWLMFILCMLVIYMVTGMPNPPPMFRAYFYFVTASFVLKLEWIFIIAYIYILREIPDFIKIFKQHRLTSSLIILWLLTLSYSFFTSPMDLTVHPRAWSRYYQILTHVLFFIFIWDFFNRYKPNIKWLIYSICASSLITIFYFFYEWFFNHPYSDSTWFMSPPHNSHIRHTGYQVEATLCFFIAFFLQQQNRLNTYINIFILTILWAFLFWMGGRGMILALGCTLLLLFPILNYNNASSKKFYLIMIATAVFGFILAELFAVYHWNGLLSALTRSLEAESFNRLSSLRLYIWQTTAPSLLGNLSFGLGPQSYFFLSYGYYSVQPHNVILQFLFEWGIIGTFLFSILITKAIWSGFKSNLLTKGKNINSYALASFAVILSLSINALVDGTYYHPQPSVYLAIAFAILIIPTSKQDQ